MALLTSINVFRRCVQGSTTRFLSTLTSSSSLKHYHSREDHVISCIHLYRDDDSRRRKSLIIPSENDCDGDRRFAIWRIQRRGKKRKAEKEKRGKSDRNEDNDDEIHIDLDVIKTKMEKAVHALENRLAQLRSGTASPAILDDIRVECYESNAPLQKVAHVSIRDPTCLSIGIFDPEITENVQKAIRAANLNLNPIAEGKGRLRVPLPKPTAESREALKKTAGKEAEIARIAIRNIRKDAMKLVKGAKGHMMSSEHKRLEQSVQKCTDDHVAVIDQRIKAKLESISTS